MPANDAALRASFSDLAAPDTQTQNTSARQYRSHVDHIFLDDSPPPPSSSHSCPRLPPLSEPRSTSPRVHRSAATPAARPTASGSASSSSPIVHSPLPTSVFSRQPRRSSPPFTTSRPGGARRNSSLNNNNTADVSLTWDDDVIDLINPEGDLSASDQQFLAGFLDEEFSSPSTYPAFLPLSSVTGGQRRQPAQPSPSTHHQAPAHHSAGTAFAPANVTFGTPSRTTTQLTASTIGDPQPSLFDDDNEVDLFGDDLLPDTPSTTSFSESVMPATRTPKRAVRAAAAALESVPSKRRRTSRTTQREGPFSLQPDAVRSLVRQSTKDKDDEDLFGEEPVRQPVVIEESEDIATIDLTEANTVPDELKAPSSDNRIKLSAFQCVICMDNVTTLTVTHCGHLFCAQCLHSSLHVDSTRGKCPMCRTKIEMKPRGTYTARTKGYWPLELKLMTSTKKGKRKADGIS